MPLIRTKHSGYAMDGVRLYPFKGPKAPKPDKGIGIAAQENAKIAGRMATIAEAEYADGKKLAEEFGPLFRQQIEQSVADAAVNRQRSDAQWASYTENFAPLEAKMAETARNFDTPEKREQAAREASMAVGDQFAQARDERAQAEFSNGLQPGSGRALALDNASRIEEAKAKAGAGNNARRLVETQGLALIDNATRFGRNMPSTGIQVAGQATQQGNLAIGQAGGLQSFNAQPAAVAGRLYNGAVGANSAAGDLYLGDYGAQLKQFNTNVGLVKDGIGAAGNIAGMFFSSKKMKDMGEKVSGHEASEAIEGSPSSEWSYKPGEGDGSTKPRMGPTAEGLQAVAPEVSDGRTVDGISMLGLHHAAIGDQSKRLRRVEKALGLADAEAGDVNYREVA